ncbi:MAG: ArsA-related P-loop ATPase [Myxococcota bacterium]
MSLAPLLDGKRVIICVGSGGVGKTTCAAALGLQAALRGRKTLVLTIDPARRLATSVGLAELDHVERPVEGEVFRAADLSPAPLHLMMLDVRRTFDELIARFAADAEARARLHKNRIYQEIAGRLAGSHEYAAMEKLRSLDEKRRYDLIVLDTPPSRNALDFLDAPGKMADAIDSPALHWITRAGTVGARGLGFGGAFVLRRLARFLGNRFLEDIAAFLGEFNALLGGFRTRAREVQALFHDPELAFVVVSTPDPQAADEAIFFAERLRASGLGVGGVAINRVRPAAPRGLPNDLAAQIARATGAAPDAAETRAAAEAMSRAFSDIDVLARADEAQVARIEQECGAACTARVPIFPQDVHDLRALAEVGRHLIGEEAD